jgi:hypothetical protein
MSRRLRSALLEGTELGGGGGVMTSGSGEGGAGHRPGRAAARSTRSSVCICSSARDFLRLCAIEEVGFAGATRMARPAGLGAKAASGLLELLGPVGGGI